MPVTTVRTAQSRSQASATPELDAVRRGASTVRRGDRGDQVQQIQQLLNARGAQLKLDGAFGPRTRRAVEAFQRERGLKRDGVVGQQTLAALQSPNRGASASSATGEAEGATATGRLPFTPNARAVARAARTSAGRQLLSEAPKHAAMYKKASRLTGVPASLIGAIHGQESGFGKLRTSTRGPESGFGLDPRSVSTAWGNRQLKRHGLGRWKRGVDSAEGRLQSAVIAAEHFKRNARAAGVNVNGRMSARDLAVATTAYIAGPNSSRTKAAKRTGKSFVFNPGDSNPHPYHPGGTSVGRGGRRIRVRPGRKSGLLRWDVMLGMLNRTI